MGQRMINKGGERVIHDTIQAIQEAEAKADAIVKDADEKAEEMLAQAKQEEGRCCQRSERSGEATVRCRLRQCQRRGSSF